MEYQRTKDILHVMRLLGHRNITNTLIYTHLVDFEAVEYVSKVAKNVKEAHKLVDAGLIHMRRRWRQDIQKTQMECRGFVCGAAGVI